MGHRVVRPRLDRVTRTGHGLGMGMGSADPPPRRRRPSRWAIAALCASTPTGSPQKKNLVLGFVL